MTRLPISKATEAKVLATIYEMGAESLDPENYENLETIVRVLCATRSINNEALATELVILSGRKSHYSDCRTSDAPAIIPAPCNCKYHEDSPELFDGTRKAINDLSIRTRG